MTDDKRDSGIAPEDLPTETLGADDAATLAERVKRPESERTISIPNYRILELLGSGGMGEVYAAEQERPIRRRVAIKVVKLGMDSRGVIARFESEREALAMMNHPSIATVYDAGTTDNGSPFFAMEYVPGESFTRYCDRHRLGIRRRLELFLKACDGVQHAHQKGIIHRDLKPDNVMITIQDEAPVPKIIDFGLAKATSLQPTDRAFRTELGAMVGTVPYMSPEQVIGLDIDTRTDVYALGVLLYKLLVGALPFTTEEPGHSAYLALLRKIQEDEPAKPSTRLSELGESAAEVAKDRNLQLPALAKQLGGDLDWITLKALEKDRTRRYQTAYALAADVRRHLTDQPVLASPPGTIYRARKFVRRHRIAVVGAVLVAFAVVVGTVGTTVGLLRALRAEGRANEEAEAARQVSTFLVDLFAIVDPNESQGESITAREILDEGSKRVSRELREQPLIQARLMDTMGTVYRHLGLFEESRALAEPALETRQSLLDEDSLEVAESLQNLAQLEQFEGRYKGAQELAERALKIREAGLGSDHPKVADSLMTLGWSLARQSNYDRATRLFERALAIREIALGADDPDVAASRGALGIAQSQMGNPEAAEPLLTRALATYERTLGPDDYRIGAVLNDLAILHWNQGRHATAAPLFERSIAIKERVVGPGHYRVALGLNNLALVYDGQDRSAEAEPLLRRALLILEESLGSDHDYTALGLANLAWVLYRQGKYDDAEPLYERALGVYDRTVGSNHTSVAILLRDQARLFVDQGRYAKAEQALQRSAEIWEATRGPEHPNLAECIDSLADLYVEQGRLLEAEPLFQRALAIREKRLGADHPATRESGGAYAALLRRAGRPGDAEDLERRLRIGTNTE